MKKLTGEVRLVRVTGSADFFSIQVTDKKSGLRVVEVQIRPEDIGNFVSTLAAQCEILYDDSGKLGLRREIKEEPVNLPPSGAALETDEVLADYEVDGWKARRQDVTNPHRQFAKDGQWYATVLFERHVEE